MREKFFMLTAGLAARRDLTALDKLLVAVIADHIGRNGHAWAGERRLAREAGVLPSTVSTSLRRIEAADPPVLEVERRGQGRTNHYRLPPESVRQPGTPSKAKVSGKPVHLGKPSVRQPRTEVYGKPVQNQIDPVKKKKKGAPSVPDFPELLTSHPGLDTPKFRKAWTDWSTYRRQRGNRLTKMTANQQLRKLAAAGSEAAVVMIEQSIFQGWTGLFPKKPEAKRPYASDRPDEKPLYRHSDPAPSEREIQGVRA